MYNNDKNIGNYFAGSIEHVEINTYNADVINIESKDKFNIHKDIRTKFDYSYVPELNKALNLLDKASDTIEADTCISDIKREINSNEPNVGIIQASFTALKKACTNDKFIRAVEVFGGLLVNAIK